MKYLAYTVVFFSLLCFVASCGGKNNGEQTNTQDTNMSVPDSIWDDPYKVSLNVEKYFKEEIFPKKKVYLEIEDDILKHLWFLKVKKVNREEIKVMSLGAACIGAKMYVHRMDDKPTDTVDVDFKIIWDQNIVNPDQTKGNTRVDQVYIRAVNGVERYKWRQDGKFFERILLDDILKQNEATKTVPIQ